MKAEVKRKKDEGRTPAASLCEAVAPARHSRESGNPAPLRSSSFRTSRSGGPESSAFAPARHSGAGRNPVAAAAIQRTPTSWRETTLGEILPLKYGKARSQDVGYSRPDSQTFGSNGAFGTFDRAITEGPSIIVGRKGAAGLVHYSAEPCWPIDTAFYTEGSDKTYLPFFRYLLESLRLGQFDRSTAIPSLSRDDYNARRIAYPERVEEQRRIVAEVEKQFTRLDAGVAALRHVQANLKRYRAAVLKAACEGRLVPTEAELAKAEGRTYETGEQLLTRILADRRKHWHGRGKYKEPAATDTANLPLLPQGWVWASVEQLLKECLCNGVSVKGSHHPPGVRALRLSAMSDSGFDYSDARYLPLPDSAVDDLWIQEGDFFISRGNGSLHLVGRGTFAQQPPQPTIFPDTMTRLRLTDVIRKSGWIHSLWRSRIIRSQIEVRVKTTAGIYKIAQPQVGSIVVPIPPIVEQTRIVAEVERRLSVIEELEATVAANVQRAIRLRQSVLQCAFARP